VNVVEDFLAGQPFMVLDGAFGSELASRGFDTNDALWSAKALLDAPQLVQEVHRDYYAAGADVCTSASYQASVDGFLRRGLSRDEARALIARSVELLKQTRDEFTGERAAKNLPPALAAASIGPYGAYLADGSEYTGAYSLGVNGLREFHRERIGILAAAEPDIFAVETIPLLEEAVAVMLELAPFDRIPAWVSFSCRDARTTCGGDDIAECAQALSRNPQVAAIGVNCTDPRYIEELIGVIRSACDKPVVVYPNRGEQYDPFTKTWSGGAESFVQYVERWHEAGARLIGGCCRTGPEDIAQVASFRDSLAA
jgi:homocysteine S-methyltransferase